MDMDAAGRKNRTLVFKDPPVITAWASAAGKLESQGPLGESFDLTCPDPYWGETTFEQAEQTMQKQVLSRLLAKAGLGSQDLDLVFSGDLLNQCTASSFALRNQGIPHLGLYGACSTMAEALILSAVTAAGGFAGKIAAMASSHFCSCERQYRLPLGYGGQRTPTAQWTVTGAGAVLVEPAGSGVAITACTPGTVRDLGLKDPNNMGCAMAPAAWDTIRTHLQDTGRSPEDYDQIVTGDLGQLGKEMVMELADREGICLGGRLMDCGSMIFDNTRQQVNAGGSGAGCSASVLCAALLEPLQKGRLRRILFCGTGALLSPLTTQQGLPIPGICHAVALESP